MVKEKGQKSNKGGGGLTGEERQRRQQDREGSQERKRQGRLGASKQLDRMIDRRMDKQLNKGMGGRMMSEKQKQMAKTAAKGAVKGAIKGGTIGAPAAVATGGTSIAAQAGLGAIKALLKKKSPNSKADNFLILAVLFTPLIILIVSLIIMGSVILMITAMF